MIIFIHKDINLLGRKEIITNHFFFFYIHYMQMPTICNKVKLHFNKIPIIVWGAFIRQQLSLLGSNMERWQPFVYIITTNISLHVGHQLIEAVFLAFWLLMLETYKLRVPLHLWLRETCIYLSTYLFCLKISYSFFGALNIHLHIP